MRSGASATKSRSVFGSRAVAYTFAAPALSSSLTVASGLTVNPVTYGTLSGLDAAQLTSNNVVLTGVIAGDVGNVELDTNGYTATFTETNASADVPVTVPGVALP